ncbi:hypothetical protein [Streptomyces sp. XY66]|uniref:hypothetical protein n=1 Tax=Streptomyces sp. XY66 TaxID=1415563 RepID=UPI000AD7A620|nr:hypothetical protein [Streptomyces sp. XY66]
MNTPAIHRAAKPAVRLDLETSLTNNRPRARLTAGGTTWDLRTKAPAQRPPQGPVPETDALMALNEAVVGLRIAFKEGDYPRAWAMRREAWRYADLLPPGRTRQQRRALGQYKELLLAAQRLKRSSK